MRIPYGAHQEVRFQPMNWNQRLKRNDIYQKSQYSFVHWNMTFIFLISERYRGPIFCKYIFSFIYYKLEIHFFSSVTLSCINKWFPYSHVRHKLGPRLLILLNRYNIRLDGGILCWSKFLTGPYSKNIPFWKFRLSNTNETSSISRCKNQLKNLETNDTSLDKKFHSNQKYSLKTNCLRNIGRKHEWYYFATAVTQLKGCGIWPGNCQKKIKMIILRCALN